MKKLAIIITAILLVIAGGIGSFYVSYIVNKPAKKPEPKEKIYKVYYLDSVDGEKPKLTYYTKKLETATDKVEQMTKLLEISMRGHDNGYSPFPSYAKMLSVTLEGNTAVLNVNEQFILLQPEVDKLKEVAVDCIVNTLTQVKNVHNVRIRINGVDTAEKMGAVDLANPVVKSLEKYEIAQTEEGKVPEYLTKIPYADKDKVQYFTSLPTSFAAKEVKVSSVSSQDAELNIKYAVSGKSTVKVPAMPKKYEEVCKVTADGLFIDGVKFLDKSLYVGSTWDVTNFKPLIKPTDKQATYAANFKIQDVFYKQENGKIYKEYEVVVTVPELKTKTQTTYVENIIFRVGEGIYKRNIIDPSSTVHTRLDVYVIDAKTALEKKK